MKKLALINMNVVDGNIDMITETKITLIHMIQIK